MKLKQLLSGALAGVLAFSMAYVAPVSAEVSSAQEITGVKSEYIAKTDGENVDTPELTLWDAGENITIGDASKFTISADVYLPAQVFAKTDKDNTGINIAPSINIAHRSMETGGLVYDIDFERVDMDEKSDGLNWRHWSDVTQTSVDKPSYASLTKVDDFVKVSLTDVPVDAEEKVHHTVQPIEGDGTESEIALSEVPANDYSFALRFTSEGWGFSDRGNYFISNVVLKYDGTAVALPDYSDTTQTVGDYFKDQDPDDYGTDVKPTTFRTLFQVGKTSAKTPAKKSVTVSASPHFADSLDVASSDAKIATASYADGKITIKGLKKGTATITATSCGVSREIEVTVGNAAFSVAKTKVSVKKKKSVKVSVTRIYDTDKVSVKSANKKIATAAYKNGKIVIKGVKKGKTTVTAKSGGMTKKIKVTVK